MMAEFAIASSSASNPLGAAPFPVVPPLQRVGVIGGGQLAWMMTEAAQPLGIEVFVQTPSRSDPAVANAEQAGYATATEAIVAPLNDVAATAQLAQRCQVITFENEFVDLKALQALADQGVEFRPALSALAPLLDKYEQRSHLQSLGLPVPSFDQLCPEMTPEQLGLGWPLVVKSRRHGYDGQGTFILSDQAALAQFWQQLSSPPETWSNAFMAEAFVSFERELAVMAARSLAGEVVIYPVVETHQQDQVCHWAIAPVSLQPSLNQDIRDIATTLLNQLQVVGIFGIELFLSRSGQVLVNEIAPRTHNSGHMTIDACRTSQFEQHLRAICGHPLGDPSLLSPGAVMVNLLGFEVADHDYGEKRRQLATIPNACVHWYGKFQARSGRKLGHVTVPLESQERHAALQVVEAIEAIWYHQTLGI